ncbi:MAG: hypothetical protein IKJ74_00790 [Clostridia bacterium]|nr:hypothetical protein [Clostridia bacterium]
MKKIVALLLLAAMLTMSLCSCTVDMEDMGSIIPMVLADPQTDLDPTEMIYDKDFVKVSSLLYEGLTQVKDGKIEPAIAEAWEEKYNESRDEYFLYIDIFYSRWNDGRTLSADHFAYAWKRILSPETDSPAAALLYDIKNAREVKAGNMTIDDLGVAAVDSNTLEVQFEKPIDVELFLEAISSPALIPLRDDAVQGKEDVWSTNTNDISTNGKFSIKSMDPAGEYRLDFSKYYRLEKDPEDGYNVFVKPYQLVTDFAKYKTSEEAVAAFDNGEIYYVGTFTTETYAAKEKEIKSSDTLSSYTYFFNCENDVLSDAKVRKALSSALNREEIAKIIGMGSKAAAGFVSDVATGATMKASFRKEAGDLYKTAGDVEGAKALLKEAGVTSGDFAITYREDRAYEQKVAEYAKGVWETLGFKVDLKGVSGESYESALYGGKFDVIALDYQALSTNAYSALAPFAPSYSGSVVEVTVDSVGTAKHVTGFESEAYTNLLNEVLDLTTRKDRAKKLVEVEKLLGDECPAAALVFYAHNYLASSELKGLETSPYGHTIFTEAKLKDYAEKNAAYQAAQDAE